INAPIAGAVDLHHIHRAAVGDFPGLGIVLWKIGSWAIGAIEALGENAGNRRLARAARADEEVSMGDAFLPDGIGQRLRDMLLADNILEPLRAVLACYDLIRHLKPNI